MAKPFKVARLSKKKIEPENFWFVKIADRPIRTANMLVCCCQYFRESESF